MPTPIALSADASPAVAVPPPRPGGLDADLAKMQKQLSDCVNCPVTAKSAEGKAKIQDFSHKIDAIKSKLKMADEVAAQRVRKAKEAPRPEAGVAAASASPGPSARLVAATDAGAATGDAANKRRPALSALGGFVDVHA